MVKTFALLLAAGAALGACKRAAPPAAPEPQAQVRPDDAAVAAYVQAMTVDDPATCFGTADLRTASFAGREDAPAPVPPARVVIAVDASGSMAGRVGGATKLALAKTAASGFLDGLPAAAEAGVLVFGQAGSNLASGKDASCRAVALATPLTRDRGAVAGAVASVRAVGWTPLAAALTRAEALLTAGGKPGEQVIYVVSDGQETCGGDPVAVARAINRGPTRAVVNIIGFAVPNGEAAALQAVAQAGGGRFVNSATDAELQQTLARIREANRQARNSIVENDTTARNSIDTDNVIARARICTSNIIARERIAVSNDIARKRIAGRPVAVEEKAEQLMETRHVALERRTEAFATRLDAERKRVNAAVQDAAATVK